jgi:hypothetical protein
MSLVIPLLRSQLHSPPSSARDLLLPLLSRRSQPHNACSPPPPASTCRSLNLNGAPGCAATQHPTLQQHRQRCPSPLRAAAPAAPPGTPQNHLQVWCGVCATGSSTLLVTAGLADAWRASPPPPAHPSNTHSTCVRDVCVAELRQLYAAVHQHQALATGSLTQQSCFQHFVALAGQQRRAVEVV